MRREQAVSCRVQLPHSLECRPTPDQCFSRQCAHRSTKKQDDTHRRDSRRPARAATLPGYLALDIHHVANITPLDCVSPLSFMDTMDSTEHNLLVGAPNRPIHSNAPADANSS